MSGGRVVWGWPAPPLWTDSGLGPGQGPQAPPPNSPTRVPEAEGAEVTMEAAVPASPGLSGHHGHLVPHRPTGPVTPGPSALPQSQAAPAGFVLNTGLPCKFCSCLKP